MGELLQTLYTGMQDQGGGKLHRRAAKDRLERYADRRGLHKFDVHIANHVICKVVADVQMLYLAVLVHLLKDVLVEILFSHTSILSSHSLECL